MINLLIENNDFTLFYHQQTTRMSQSPNGFLMISQKQIPIGMSLNGKIHSNPWGFPKKESMGFTSK
jgi:hypothetical protein